MFLACTVGSQHGQGVQYRSVGTYGTSKAGEQREGKESLGSGSLPEPHPVLVAFPNYPNLRHPHPPRPPKTLHTPALLSNKSVLSL